MRNRPDSAIGRGVMEFARAIDGQTSTAAEAGARFELTPVGA